MDEDFVEVIKEGEIVKMTKMQAREEDLFILRNVIEPVGEVISDRVNEAERQGVSVNLDDWRLNRGIGYKKNDVLRELKDNFQWEIVKVRRAKGMTRQGLAESIGVSEEEIKIIELGGLPRDDFVLVNKIESVLSISLRKEKPAGGVTLADLQKMNEGDVKGALDKSRRESFGGDKVDDKGSRGEGVSGSDIEIIE
jgi:ribosome-binding protein aMBF1 (putative translation factor)